ncbi:hypothetical protein [Thioalkalivibrio sp. HK1]|uniref:hypothetical protein n=1 Tax=Thioalkalivibrio sp. HK1 TaxID=1469245 RepID=UPI00046FE04F|nr:hypothetical protein [Thioalkalivibrio sp. HK1]
MKYDVIIVGGGIVGATLGLALGGDGMHVRPKNRQAALTSKDRSPQNKGDIGNETSPDGI